MFKVFAICQNVSMQPKKGQMEPTFSMNSIVSHAIENNSQYISSYSAF